MAHLAAINHYQLLIPAPPSLLQFPLGGEVLDAEERGIMCV